MNNLDKQVKLTKNNSLLFSYIEVEDGIEITKYMGGEEKLIIPEEIDGKTVVSIGDKAFINDYTVTTNEVTIPKTVKRISARAFCYMYYDPDLFIKKIDKININKNNQYLLEEDGIIYSNDKKIIFYCSNKEISKYIMPNTVENISAYVFFGCEKLKEIELSENLRIIEKYAFSECKSLNNINLPESLEEIHDCAFSIYRNKNLKLEIPKNVRVLGKDIGDNISISEDNNYFCIDENCLMNKEKTKIIKCLKIDSSSFKIPDKVIEISDGAFSFKNKLKEVIFNNKLEVIGENAFYSTSINSVKLPKSVKSIGVNAFLNTEEYPNRPAEIKLERGNKNLITDGKTVIKINEDGTKTLIRCFKMGILKYDIPEGVTVIERGAFENCQRLKNVTIPEGVLYIKDWAFYLTDIHSLNIPSTVKDLGERELTYIDNLELKVSEENKVYKYKNDILYKRQEDKYILIKCFKNKGLNKINIDENVTEIRGSAFRGCDSLTEVIIPDSVIKIGKEAFSYCSKLTNFSLSKSITNIADGVFCGGGFTTLEIPSQIKSIAYGAFSGCRKLTKVLIPKETEFIGSDSFEECTKLTAYCVDKDNEKYCDIKGVLYNKKKTKIEDFPCGKSAVEYKVPAGVISIGSAFKGCEKVKKIILADTVEEIGDEGFSNCDKLAEITIPGTVKNIGNHIFGYWRNNDEKINVYGETGSAIDKYIKDNNYEKYAIFIDNNESEDIIKLKKEFNYTINNDEVTINEYLGKDNKLIIPEKIEGKMVTEIGEGAFEGKGLKEVIISDSIIKIGKNAFKFNGELTKVKLSQKLLEIPNEMFSCCYNLGEIEIPNNVKAVGKNAFEYCKLTKIVIPESVTSIDKNVFGQYEYDSYNAIIVGDYGSCAEDFAKERKMKFVSSKESIEDIKVKQEYHYCINEEGNIRIEGIKEDKKVINIPSYIEGKAVTEIVDSYYWENAKYSKSIVISENVKKITLDFKRRFKEIERIIVDDNNKFFSSDENVLFNKDKSELIKVINNKIDLYEVPKEVIKIRENAFVGCRSLTTVKIRDNVRNIGNRAFNGCSNLSVVNIESEKIEIGELAFRGTKWFDESELIILGQDTLYRYKGNDKVFKIPEGIKKIQDNAFSMEEIGYRTKDELKTVIIPESVTEIGARAFANRTKLMIINIPSKVAVIKNNTFSNCISLEKITIPEGLTRIEAGAFEHCEKLKEIKIPEFVESLEEKVFYNCNSLTRIDISKNIKVIHDTALPNYGALGVVKIDEANESYCDIDGVLFDKEKKTLLYFPPNSSITEYIIPDTVENISETAFLGNKNLISVIISKNVKGIGKFAFIDCAKLEKVEFKCEIEVIGSIDDRRERGVFDGCINLKEIIWPQGLKTIGTRAFANTGLKEVEIPDTVTKILNYAFSEIKADKLIIPKTVMEIGLGAFSSVKEIIVYDTITPNAKMAEEYLDEFNGKPNSNLGFVGLYPQPMYSLCAASPNTTWRDHMIIVKSHKTDEILYKVWMGGKGETREYYCTLSSSWGKNASFNFNKLDESFSKIKVFDNKVKVAINRLKYPYSLTEEKKEIYEKYLKRSIKKIVESLINNNDLDTLLDLDKYKFITKTNIKPLIELANNLGKTEILTYLMDYEKNNIIKK